jgi:aspartate/methionine/tyrosine aminotransferase
MPDFPFARRTGWDTSDNALTRTLRRLKAGGASIRDLTVSNPAECAFRFSSLDWIKDLGHPDNARYTPDPRGLLPAREAIAEDYARQGIAVDPERIFLTSGTSEGYSHVFRLIADPGDRVLFPRPSYPLFHFLGDLNDVELDFYDLNFEGRWQVDRASVRSRIGARTKAVVVVNPNNPTGSYCGNEDREFLRDMCGSRAALISDEVFFDYSLEARRPSSLLQGAGALTFVLNGLSKALALPQMKLSWIVVGGPPEVVRDAMRRLEVIADTYLSVGAPAQNAAPRWLARKETVQSEIRQRLTENLACLRRQTAGLGARLYPVEGGWYAVLRLPEGADEETVVLELLDRHQVLAHPGYFFDFPESRPHLVLSLLTPPEVWKEGGRGIAEYVKG